MSSSTRRSTRSARGCRIARGRWKGAYWVTAGYWDNAAWITADPGEPTVLVSIYLRPDDAEYLLVVSNITKQPHDVTISLDSSKFDLSNRAARDLLRDGEAVALDGRTIKTHMDPEDFRLIAIR